MAAGEKTFTTQGRKTERFMSEPLENKEWQGTLDTKAVSVKVSPKNFVPYIGGLKIRAHGSAKTEGGKDRYLFINYLALDATPSPKDGVCMVDRGGQIVELAAASAHALTVNTQSVTSQDGSVTKTILDPKSVIQWLKDLDGVEISFRTKTEKDESGNRQSRVDYFIEGSSSRTSFSGKDIESDEDVEDDDDDEEPAPSKKSKK